MYKRQGYDGPKTEWGEPGSNGLLLDAQGRLTVCDHGNRRVYRVEKDGTRKTIVDRFEGKRFNSPNDLIIHSNGDLYFTRLTDSRILPRAKLNGTESTASNRTAR